MATVTFSPRTSFDATVTFRLANDGGKEVSVDISKRETVALVYELGVLFLGINREDQNEFILTINGQTPTLKDRGGIYFYAIKKLAVEPYQDKAIQVTETLEDGTSNKVWFVLQDLRWKVMQTQEKADGCLWG